MERIMVRRVVMVGLGLLAGAALTGMGCGSSSRENVDRGDASAISRGPEDANILANDGPQACSGTHCSSDLRSLVDCDGNALMTCPPDQGCQGTGCVDACQAASDSRGSIGCEFYAVDPDIYTGDGAAGGCFAAFVANTWDTPVSLEVEYDGAPLDPSVFARIPVGSGASIQYQPLPGGQIPAGQVAILFLNRFGTNPVGLVTDCPAGITPAVTTSDAAAHGTAIGKAFHIKTNAPVSAYDILPYGGGRSALTSATLLVPTSAWDTNYVAVDAYRDGTPTLSSPFVVVVAKDDNTTVSINPTGAVAAGTGVAAAAKGATTTYTLNRGQTLQLESAGGGFPPTLPSLSGSVVQADHPVGLWGGKTTLGMFACCDESAHQQIPPVRALGSEYVGVRYRNRYDGVEEAPPWRLVGAVDGTILTWDPVMPAGTKTLLHRGEVMEFMSNGPFIVKSQDKDHPFYMSAHMTGAGSFDPGQNGGSGKADGRGDAEFVNVIPPGEYMESYVLFTDPTYPETDLVVVRTRGPNGFKDVTLDCAGTLGGWEPVGTTGQYEYTRFDLVRHNFARQGQCDNGRHEMRSKGSFGVTVWGWGSAETDPGFSSQYVSYAYPAGASVQPINDVVVVVK
jgi:hypothetical protein